MRAVVLRSHGGPEVLGIEDVPAPEPGAGEVLVDVRATAMNRADLLQRMGLYPDPFPGPLEIPGLEFAGTVAALGEGVDAWSVGDEVMGIVSGGAYAEQLVIDQHQAMLVPRSVPVADAAAIPEAFLTAWDALVVQGGLAAGMTALVHAGASGVGTAAIQICRAIGADVIVTCSAGKAGLCTSLGAVRAVDYATEDFVAVVAEVTGGRGVEVVLDVIAGDYVAKNVAALAVGGRIIQVGAMAGKPEPFNVAALLPKRATIIGTVLRPRPTAEKAALSQRFVAEMLGHFDAGVMRPIIDSRYALTDIAEAHRHMAANANSGKIVIDVR